MSLLRVQKTPCGQALTVPQAHTLMFLLERPEGAVGPTQQVLAEYLRLDKGTITRLIRSLNNPGFVRVDSCSSDKRAKCIRLTEQGERMAGQVDRASNALFTQVLHNLPTKDRDGIAPVVQQLTQAIQQLKLGSSS